MEATNLRQRVDYSNCQIDCACFSPRRRIQMSFSPVIFVHLKITWCKLDMNCGEKMLPILGVAVLSKKNLCDVATNFKQIKKNKAKSLYFLVFAFTSMANGVYLINFTFVLLNSNSINTNCCGSRLWRIILDCAFDTHMKEKLNIRKLEQAFYLF